MKNHVFLYSNFLVSCCLTGMLFASACTYKPDPLPQGGVIEISVNDSRSNELRGILDARKSVRTPKRDGEDTHGYQGKAVEVIATGTVSGKQYQVHFFQVYHPLRIGLWSGAAVGVPSGDADLSVYIYYQGKWQLLSASRKMAGAVDEAEIALPAAVTDATVAVVIDGCQGQDVPYMLATGD